MPIRRDDWKTYHRLLVFARPYAARLALGVFFGAVFGGSTGGLIVGGQRVMAKFLGPVDLHPQTMIWLAAIVPCFALVRGLGQYFSTYCVQWVGARVVMDLRNAAFSRLQELSLDYYARIRGGDTLSRVINDTNTIEKSVSNVLGDLAQQPFVLLFSMVLVFYFDWRLALVSMLAFPICIIPIALFGKRVRRYSHEGQSMLGEALSVLQEAVAGVRVVKAFGMEDYERQRFAKQSRGVFSRAVRVSRASAANEPIIVFISTIGLSLVCIYAHATGMTWDKLFAFAAAMMAMYEPVKKLSRINVQVQLSSAAADRVFELIDQPVTVREKPDATPFAQALQSVAFDNVTFAYDTHPVLNNVQLAVRAGQCVAFVGSSGSGKSTMVSLIPRFFDATSGRVLVNGTDVRDVTVASLRKLIGIVSQETFLFNDTIANNIAYGQTGATKDQIEQAARRALAHDFILQKPAGYDTVVGDRGVQLSGGQAQRIAIARAILRNPPILILDEATSALDTESERQVQAALNELMSGRTVFAIAHRLSTVTHADLIVVLDKGRIAEQGTHDELLKRGGLYKYYYELQFKDAVQV